MIDDASDLDAATFLLSAVTLAFLRLPGRPVRSDEQRTGFWEDTVAGLRYIAATPLIRAIGLGFFAIVAFNGIDDVALVFLARDFFHGGDSAASVLLAAVGIGLFLGYALLARTPRIGMVALLLAGFAISSAGNLLTGLAWAVTAAFVLQAVRGLGIVGMDVAVNTLREPQIP